MESTHQIALVDDHRLFADGFKALLSQAGKGYHVTVYDSPNVFLKAYNSGENYDLIVLDLVMSGMNGLALLSAIRGLQPRARVLMLSGISSEPPRLEMMRLGASGFVHKSADMDALLNTVEDILAGKPPRWGSDAETQALEAEALETPGEAGQAPQLGPRQLDVLNLIAQGATNRDIAATLEISENTVKSHMRAIFEILGVRTRTACVRKAQSLGFV
jgi:DNA-binding NarL/FixJ family response regulator